MDLMCTKKTSRKQYRLLLLMLIFSLLHDQSVGTNDTFHLMEESTWLEAQENCIRNGGHLASHEDISKSDVQQKTSCLTSEQIWLDKVKVVTPYISHKGSEAQSNKSDGYGNIAKCFIRCHTNKEFKYSDGLCKCKGNGNNDSTNEPIFNVEEERTDDPYMAKTIGTFICLGAAEAEPIKTFASSVSLRSSDLQTVCRFSRNDRVILLNSTHETWEDADAACARYGGYLPISIAKEDCQQLNVQQYEIISFWSGTRSYVAEILFKESLSTETLKYSTNMSEYRKYVNCAHVKSLDKMTDSDKCISIDTQLKYICITGNDVDLHGICSNKQNAQYNKVTIGLLACVLLVIPAAVYIVCKRRNNEGVCVKMFHSKKEEYISRQSRNRSVNTTKLKFENNDSNDSELTESLYNNTEDRNGAYNTDLTYLSEDLSKPSNSLDNKTREVFPDSKADLSDIKSQNSSSIACAVTLPPDITNVVNVYNDKTNNPEMTNSHQEDGMYIYHHLDRNT